MGRIRGDVESVGIASILQMLSMSGSTGILTVQCHLKKKAFQFGPGGMRLLSTGSRTSDPLEEVLLRSGRVARPALEELLKERRKSGAHLGVLLVERGVLTRADLEQIIQDQIAEEIYDLFTWSGATFEWTGEQSAAASDTQGGPPGLALDTNAASVLLQATRLADELARIHELIPDTGMVPVHLAEIPISGEDPRLGSGTLSGILPRINDRRTVIQIIEESGAHKFQVLSTLYELVQRGSVEVRDKDGLTSVRKRKTLPSFVAPRSGASILILSVDRELTLKLSSRLRTAGYDIREAQGELQLADLGSDRPVNAIILDASIDTEEGLKQAVRLRETTGVPFLSFSRNASPEAIANALRSGARHVLLRPIKEELLLERLAELVRE